MKAEAYVYCIQIDENMVKIGSHGGSAKQLRNRYKTTTSTKLIDQSNWIPVQYNIRRNVENLLHIQLKTKTDTWIEGEKYRKDAIPHFLTYCKEILDSQAAENNTKQNGPTTSKAHQKHKSQNVSNELCVMEGIVKRYLSTKDLSLKPKSLSDKLYDLARKVEDDQNKAAVGKKLELKRAGAFYQKVSRKRTENAAQTLLDGAKMEIRELARKLLQNEKDPERHLEGLFSTELHELLFLLMILDQVDHYNPQLLDDPEHLPNLYYSNLKEKVQLRIYSKPDESDDMEMDRDEKGFFQEEELHISDVAQKIIQTKPPRQRTTDHRIFQSIETSPKNESVKIYLRKCVKKHLPIDLHFNFTTIHQSKKTQLRKEQKGK